MADEADGSASDTRKDKRGSALPKSATSSPSNIIVKKTKKVRTPFQPGDRVCISGVKQGTLLYYGKTHIAPGAWCGIELDEPEGIHDGEIDGTRYFTCKNRQGIFAPSDRVERFIDKWSLSSPDDVDSESSQATSPQKSRILPPGNLSKTFIKPKSKVSLLESDLSHFSSSDSLSDSVLSTESGEHISSPVKQSRLVKPKIVNVSGKYSEFLARNATSGNVRITDELEPEFINDSLIFEEEELSSKSDIGLPLKKQTSPVESSPSTNPRKSFLPTSRLPCFQKSTVAKEEGTKRPRLSSAPVSQELNQTYKLGPSSAQPLEEGIDPLSQDIQDTLDSDRRPFLNLTFTESISRPQQPLSSTIPDLLTPSAYYTIDSDDQLESNGTTNLQIGLPDKSTVDKSEVCSDSNSVFFDQENSAKGSESVSQKEVDSVGILSGKDLENTDLLKSIFSGLLSSHQTGSIGSEVGSVGNQSTPGSETVNVADVLTSILSSKELDQTDLLKNILCRIKSRGQTGSVSSETGSIGNQVTPSDETFYLGAVVTSTPYVSKIPNTDQKNVTNPLTVVAENENLPESESSARKCLNTTYKTEIKTTRSENDPKNLNSLHSTYRIVDSQGENVINKSASLLTESTSSGYKDNKHEDEDSIEPMTDQFLSKAAETDQDLIPSNDVSVPDVSSTRKSMELDNVDTHSRHEDDENDNRGTSIHEDMYAIEQTMETIETSFESAVDANGMREQDQLMADLTAGHTKKERPLSLMSVTSTDTGYAPDTDSELGTLTTNSPLEWADPDGMETEEHKRALYTDTFLPSKDPNIDIIAGRTYGLESDSDLYSDTGTLQPETETEREESDGDDIIEPALRESCLYECQTNTTPVQVIESGDNMSLEDNLDRMEDDRVEADQSDRVQALTAVDLTNQTQFLTNDISSSSTITSSDKNTQRTPTEGTVSEISEDLSSQSPPTVENLTNTNDLKSNKNNKDVNITDNSKSNSNITSHLGEVITSPVPSKNNHSQETGIKKVKKNVRNNKGNKHRSGTSQKEKLADKPKSESDNRSKERVKVEKVVPKIKRSAPKSKWDNIMSQIESKKSDVKPQVETRSRLEAYLTTTQKPAVIKRDVSKDKNEEAPNTIPKNSKVKSLPKKVLKSSPIPDYSKVKSKLTIATTISAPVSRSVTPRRSSGERSRSRKGSLSGLSSVQSSRSDVSVNDLDGSNGNKKLKLKQKNLTTSVSSLVKEDARPASAASIQSNVSQNSVKAMNAKNVQRSLPQPKKFNVKSSIPPIAPRKTSPSKSPARPSETRKLSPSPPKRLDNQNRNKTIRTKPVSSHLKSSNQPDLVTNSVGPNSAREISRLEALCETRTKELNYVKLQLKAGLTGFDSMAILVKYLTTELDAFSCPKVSSQLKQTKATLDEARFELAELHGRQARLEQEIQEVTTRHALLVSSLQGDHDLALNTQREQLSQEHQALFNQVANQHKIELDDLKAWHEKQITDLSMSSNRMVAQLTEQYNVDIKTLQGKHDNQMEELHKQHTDKLEDITHRFERMKMSLSDKVESLRTECEDLRSRARASEDALLRDTDTKVQLALAPFKDLPREIESLKLVIEMRNNEIRELRKQKLDIEKQLEELPVAKEKVIILNQKMENLEAIVNIKSDHEKQLSDKCQILMRKYDKETKTNKRLSMDFEELMWKAKQDLGGSTESLVKRQISRSPPSSESGSPVVMRKPRSLAASEGGRSRRSGQYLTDDNQERRLKRRSGTFLVEGKKSPTSNGKSKRHSSNTEYVLVAASQSLTDPDALDGPQPLPPPPEPNSFRERLSSSIEECEQSSILCESLDESDVFSAKTFDATVELAEISSEPCVDGGESAITISLDPCQNSVQASVEIVEINSNPSSDSSVLSSCDSCGNFTETSIEVTISSTDFTDNSEAELEYSGLQTDV